MNKVRMAALTAVGVVLFGGVALAAPTITGAMKIGQPVNIEFSGPQFNENGGGSNGSPFLDSRVICFITPAATGQAIKGKMSGKVLKFELRDRFTKLAD